MTPECIRDILISLHDSSMVALAKALFCHQSDRKEPMFTKKFGSGPTRSASHPDKVDSLFTAVEAERGANKQS